MDETRRDYRETESKQREKRANANCTGGVTIVSEIGRDCRKNALVPWLVGKV